SRRSPPEGTDRPQLLTALRVSRILAGPCCKVVMYAMESYRPRRSSLARGRPRRAPGQRRGMAASVVLPVGVRALRAVVLDPVPPRGQLEIVTVHSSRAHPGH